MICEASFSFFIENDDRERFDEILEALQEIDDIIELEHYDDGEDFCIDCIANIEIKDKVKNIENAVTKVINKWMDEWYAAWDFHYVKADNGYYWQP